MFLMKTEDRADNNPDAENSNVTAESVKSVSGSTSSSNSTGQGQTEERVPTASSSNSTGQGQTEERVPQLLMMIEVNVKRRAQCLVLTATHSPFFSDSTIENTKFLIHLQSNS